jgi:hypothetical protein
MSDCFDISKTWHLRAKVLNASRVTGRVAHVSVASFQEVMNISTAPRVHVSRDLQQQQQKQQQELNRSEMM